MPALGSVAFPQIRTDNTTVPTITEEIFQGASATLTVYTSGNCTREAGTAIIQVLYNVTTFVATSVPSNQSFIAAVVITHIHTEFPAKTVTPQGVSMGTAQAYTSNSSTFTRIVCYQGP